MGCPVKTLSLGIVCWGAESDRSGRWAYCVRKANPKLKTGNWTGPKPREVPKHKRRKEQVGMEPRMNSAERLPGSRVNWLGHRATTNSLSSSWRCETHFQRLWWVLSYPQGRELTFIECLLLSDTELEDSFTFSQVALSSPKSFSFFFLTHRAGLHFSASLQVGMPMILSCGQRNLEESDPLHYPVPFYRNLP